MQREKSNAVNKKANGSQSSFLLTWYSTWWQRTFLLKSRPPPLGQLMFLLYFLSFFRTGHQQVTLRASEKDQGKLTPSQTWGLGGKYEKKDREVMGKYLRERNLFSKGSVYLAMFCPKMVLLVPTSRGKIKGPSKHSESQIQRKHLYLYHETQGNSNVKKSPRSRQRLEFFVLKQQ